MRCKDLLQSLQCDDLQVLAPSSTADTWEHNSLRYLGAHRLYPSLLHLCLHRFHAEGIEVILDVVYNHTVEGDDHDPYVISFRGIDPETYYMIDQAQSTPLLNLSGCGNTVSGNHPVVKQLIIDSLVRWVEEYHVDGFRFDLASCLCRGKAAEWHLCEAIDCVSTDLRCNCSGMCALHGNCISQ